MAQKKAHNNNHTKLTNTLGSCTIASLMDLYQPNWLHRPWWEQQNFRNRAYPRRRRTSPKHSLDQIPWLVVRAMLSIEDGLFMIDADEFVCERQVRYPMYLHCCIVAWWWCTGRAPSLESFWEDVRCQATSQHVKESNGMSNNLSGNLSPATHLLLPLAV